MEKKFSIILQEYKKDKNFTNREMAELLGISERMYNYYEKGDYDGSPTKIEKYKKKLSGKLLNKSHPVPVFDTDFTAGFIEVHNNNPNIIGYIDLPQFKGCDAVVTCRNDSMANRINPGDLVGIRKILDKTDIEFGGIYGIVTNNFRLFKYLKESDKPGCIRLESENTVYSPRDIPFEKIHEIWVVQTTAPWSLIKMYL